MSGSYKFFCNKECEYFPCHATEDPDNFNCLFCYCPLYMLGDRCGGNPEFTKDGIKDCSVCMVPHGRNSYEYIISKWDQIRELARKIK